MIKHSIYLALIAVTFIGQPISRAADETKIPFKSDNDLNGWKFEYEKWLVKDGALTQLPVVSSGTGSIAWLPEVAYGDFEMNLEFCPTVTKYPGFSSFGVIYHAQSPREYHIVSFDMRPERKTIALSRPGVKKGPVRAGKAEGLTPGKWHKLRVVVKGSKHDVYLDGQLIASKTDSELSTGVIGFRVDRVPVQFRNLEIVGEKKPVTKPFTVPTQDYVTICSDAGKGGYEAFPSVVRSKKSGDLICVFYAGFKHVPSGPDERLPNGGCIAMCRSKDNGLTWSKAKIIYDTPMDDHDPTISQLSDGRLAVTICCWPDGGNHKPYIIWSEDDGVTWSKGQKFEEKAPFAKTNVPFRGKIVELEDGTLLTCSYGQIAQADKFCSGVVWNSKDGGKTWNWSPETVLKSPEATGHDSNIWEPCIVKLPENRILLIARQKMWLSESKDNGKTWSKPQPMHVRGDEPTLLLTSKNILLCGLRCRSKVRGSGVIYSKDFGRTWSEPILFAPVIGANVDLAELPDGRIFVVYYTEGNSNEQGLGSDIRGAYLKVDEKGVTVLPVEKK